MRDVIRKMLEAEAEAKRIVQEAGAETERLLAEARRQAQKLAERARRETAAEAERIIQTAERDAEREKKERLDEIASEMDAELKVSEDARRAAVEAVVQSVCGKS